MFSGTATLYQRGRLPYAPGLTEVVADVLNLDGRGRLIDVRCGPGTLALSFEALFSEIVGLDPDPGMMAEATRQAAKREGTAAPLYILTLHEAKGHARERDQSTFQQT